MRPVFTAFNPIYRDGQDWSKTFAGVEILARSLNANAPGTTCYAGDDMITWFKNLGFLEDKEFLRATEPYKASVFIRSKIWRVYQYCWAVKSCSQNFRDSVFVDLGCYDGKVVDIAQRYVPDRKWVVFDRFEGEKENHGKDLYETVKNKLKETTVIQGDLPGSIDNWHSQAPIGFVHCDLNNGEVEVQCLEKLWDRIDAHSIILLDDYGWKMYSASQAAHNEFFKSKGQTILEMPTGVGLCVKR